MSETENSSNQTLERLETLLGHQFENSQLLVDALTHPSFSHENPDQATSDNQRLEFLGDAVLGLVVAHLLYQELPGDAEGHLTRLKAAVVCEDTLAEVAEELSFGPFLRLGRGESASGGAKKPSILADTVEALLAAVYLDAGYEAAAAVIDKLFSTRLQAAKAGRLVFDAKTALQELVQSRSDARPAYAVVERSGPPHARTFTVSVSLGSEVLGEGQGRSKKEAEKRAAAAALKTIHAQDDAIESSTAESAG